MTIKSILEPSIEYSEGKTIDIDDIAYSTTVYEYNLFDTDVEIALGKSKTNKSKENVIYYSIYLIYNDELRARIGIFESKSENMVQIVDNSGSVDLSLGNVYFPKEKGNDIVVSGNRGNMIIFLNKEEFKKLIHAPVKRKEKEENDSDSEEDVKEEKIEEEEDVTEIKIKSAEENLTIAEDSWFVENNETAKPRIQTETKEDSTKEKQVFKKNSSTEWIQNYMKNVNYGLIDNEGSGDCFFAVIRDGLKDVGKVTTVEKLRKIVSENVNEEVFQEYRSLYLSFSGEIKNNEKEIDELKASMKKIQKNEKMHTRTAEETRVIKEQLSKIVDKHNSLLESKKMTRGFLNEFSYMTNIDTLEKFREYVLTPSYWADDYAISLLEKELNIKMIIMSEEAYNEKADDSVIQCGQLKDNEDTSKEPMHYIMTSYSGKHYKLITYKNKGALTFEEIPYGIKALIINKCLEKSAGPFYLINDFKKMREDMEIEIEESDDDIDVLEGDLYEKGEQIMFHGKSFNKPKPGEGQNEYTKNIGVYSELIGLAVKEKEWRRMLDDSYLHNFVVDGKSWHSVKHFMLASQFKKKNEDLYNEFSLDGNANSKIALQVEDAIKFSNENRKKIDPDFRSITSTRKEEERQKALNKKFGESEKMKNILVATKPAKLVKFQRGKDPEPDLLLMKTRKMFSTIKN